jgi:starch synthase
MAESLKVLFLSSEVMPFAKTGGLADVTGALPIALKHKGIDVRVMMPLYRRTKEGAYKIRMLIKDLTVPFGERLLKADIFETGIGADIPVYLVDREDMFDRPNLYGNSKGDYYDNLERFNFFAHSALKTIQVLDYAPDIIHCHDWQTGLVPALLKGPYKQSIGLSNAATVFTIHNIGYQGIFSPDKLSVTGLPGPQFFHPKGMEYWGSISLLKAGIVYSDAITTVSPTYATEIIEHEYGLGMEGVILERKNSLYGILNGADYNEWDPSKDPHIPVSYSLKTMEEKKKCKEFLLKEMGFKHSMLGRPLIGMVSRLDSQKGLDILVQSLEDMLKLDTILVILGSGDEKIEEALKKAAAQHPDRVAVHNEFNNPLAHRIMAGADMLLVPSRYEPCGLTQMYALKYGTVPVVRATGGLNDTIEQFDENTMTGNGFKFESYDAEALLMAIKQSVALYKDKKTWKKLMLTGMKSDFSWNKSAGEYIKIYESIRRPAHVLHPQA